MLELAPATVTEIAARWLSSEGGRLEYSLNHCSREVFLLLGDSNQKRFFGCGEGNEDGETAVSGHGFAAVSESFGDYFNHIANAECGVLHKVNITVGRRAKEGDEPY